MRMFRLATVAATALVVASCGSNPVPTVTIQAKPSRIQVGSGKFVTLTVQGTINDMSFPENMTPAPTLTTDYGSFTELEGGDEPLQTMDAIVSGGAVTQKLYAPTKPGVATVTARVVDAYGVAATAKVSVTFTAPVASTLLFSCRSQNIGVLADTSSDFSLACDASALDENSNQVKTANIRFISEAGAIVKSEDSSGDLPDYVYYPRQGERPRPKDVPPLPNEPNMMVGPETRNPRDMLATLIAYVEGDNPQTGDMFAGDPFVDMNDDQKWNEGEPFFSADGSGTYAASQTLYIWKQVKVVWSGALSSEKTIAKCEVLGGGSADLPRTGTAAHKSFKFTLLDDYYNVLAVNSLSDMINWQLSPSGMIDFDAGQLPTQAMKIRETGLALDAKGNFPASPTSAIFAVNSTYTVKAYNARTMDDIDGDKFYTVSGNISRTLTIDESGEPSNSVGDEALPPCGGTLK